MIKDEYENMRRLDQSHWWFLGMTAIILGVLNRYYKNRNDLEILDAGSGTCWLSSPLGRYGKVTALDIEPSVLNVCRERGVERVVSGDVQKIPLADSSFDLVVCSEVLYHQYVRNDRQAMREFFRILKPGGRVLVKVPAHAYLSGSHDQVNLTRERYEIDGVRKLFLETGFQIDFLSFANFFLLPLVFLKRKMEKIFQSKPESDIKKTNALFNFLLTGILKFEALLLSKISLPGGSSIIAVGQK